MSAAPQCRLFQGDCSLILPLMGAGTVDSIVTDPPYGLRFMGKRCDYDVPSVEVWRGCLRVLKPGGHLLAFSGARTYHRAVVNIEDAGFEIRDMVGWVYGSGFPKSLDVGKAIDKEAGAEKMVGYVPDRWTGKGNPLNFATDRPQARSKVTEPATEAAKQWDGWGTGLKPAHEPICLARKPLDGTVASNVLAHGTGALNIEACRVPGGMNDTSESWAQKGAGGKAGAGGFAGQFSANQKAAYGRGDIPLPSGRWPANLIHDGSEEVLAVFPQSEGQLAPSSGGEPSSKTKGVYGHFAGRVPFPHRKDSGSAARFFYCAKASKKDRSLGNNHPTVKPTDLMRYLCRLVTPPGGLILDPFMGSGSTGKAAILEGFRFLGLELGQGAFEAAFNRCCLVLEAEPPEILDLEQIAP